MGHPVCIQNNIQKHNDYFGYMYILHYVLPMAKIKIILRVCNGFQIAALYIIVSKS